MACASRSSYKYTWSKYVIYEGQWNWHRSSPWIPCNVFTNCKLVFALIGNDYFITEFNPVYFYRHILFFAHALVCQVWNARLLLGAKLQFMDEAVASHARPRPFMIYSLFLSACILNVTYEARSRRWRWFILCATIWSSSPDIPNSADVTGNRVQINPLHAMPYFYIVSKSQPLRPNCTTGFLGEGLYSCGQASYSNI